MAIKKVIEIDVDQLKAMGGLENLESQLKETDTQAKSLRQQLKELRDELATLPEGSKRWNEVSKRAGEVSDKIGDINQRIKALGSDTRVIDTVVEGAQALSGAFSIASSASALLGDENEDLQKTMMKVEAAIGLTVGIQSVANALQKDTALSMGLQTVATTVQTAAQTAYNFVVGSSIGLLKAFKIALATTGIGALVVGLGLLVSAMSSAEEATEGEEEAQNRLNRSLENYRDILEYDLKLIDQFSKAQVLRAKIAGKSEKEVQEIERQASKERLDAIDLERKRLYDLTQDKNINAETSAKVNKELVEANRAYYAELNSQDLDRLNYELDISNQRREKEEEEAKRREELRQKEIQRRKELNEDILKGQQELNLRMANMFLEENRLKQEQLDLDLANVAKLEEEQQKKEEQRIKDIDYQRQFIENENLRFEERYIALDNFNKAVLENEFITEEQKKKYADDSFKYKQILQQQEMALVEQSFGKLAVIFGKNSKLGKSFALGQALINTYQGITAELATKAVTPYEIGLKVINVAYIAKTGFDAVKKILSTNPMASSGGGSPNIGGGSDSPSPQFNIVGNSSTNQLASTISNQQQQPLRAYVVGSDVNSQAELDRNAVNTSVFD